MTTMVVRVESGVNIRNMADTMRQLKGVTEVKVLREKKFERIQGLPYTQEERIAAIRVAEEDYEAGRFVSSDELRKKHPRQ
jgi:predicted transcriptional regulator